MRWWTRWRFDTRRVDRAELAAAEAVIVVTDLDAFDDNLVRRNEAILG
jgi:hypothetical protein